MSGERYVALGLGTSRSAWFTDVARWATVGSAPIEFIKCISAEELRARLGSGRSFSVVLVDAGCNAVDRDLLDLASTQKVSVVVVEDGRTGRDWQSLGATAVLPPKFGRELLLDVLAHACNMIGGATALPVSGPDQSIERETAGSMVAVTGNGGSGTSTVAMALAQGLAEQESAFGSVLLADLQLDAELAMLHDARDIVPGVQELVEAHRNGQPGATEVRALTFDVPDRGYRLLLGLRRHRDWTALRSRSFSAALGGLRRTFGIVVADVGHEVEGESETGSVDMDERNLVARTVCATAGLVIVTGAPGVKGLHSLVRVVNGMREFGVSPSCIVAIVNRAQRSPRARAEYTRSFADLTGANAGLEPVVGPLFLPERRGLEEANRDGAALPTALARHLARAVGSALEHATPGEDRNDHPTLVTPGSLGTWSDQEAAGQ